MAQSKFLKAYCEKTNQYFGLEMQKFGSNWKVVNMIWLSPEEAKLISSDIEQPKFETNDNLIPCSDCGSRKVGGCTCAQKKFQCTKSMKYQFECVYCKNLKIDYSLPTASEVGGYAGKTIKLSQGQEVKIRYADDRPLKKIIDGIGWDPTNTNIDMDVDSSVVVMGAGKKDLIYFGNLAHTSGCVEHHGDNLTGEGSMQEDDENITVKLDKVPAGQDKLVFVLNIFNATERNQTLESVKNLYIRLYDPDSKKALIEYKINGNTGKDNAMIIGAAIRKNGSWSFKAIGRSLKVSSVHALAELCDV